MDYSKEKKTPEELDNEIIAEALDRFRKIESYEADARARMLDDAKFANGEQWEPQVESRREAEDRPVLTISKINRFTDRLINEQRQNKPSSVVRPRTENATKKGAKYRKGLMKYIQYRSKSALAYQQGFQDAVIMGRGHWLVTSAWTSDESLEQDIEIDTINDPLNVYMSISRKEIDYSDCDHGFYVKNINRKDFEKEYPEQEISNFPGNYDGWFTEDTVRVASYYCRKTRPRKLLLLETDGEYSKIFKDEIDKDVDFDTEIKPYIVKERDVDFVYWMWYKITGNAILKREELKGIKTIPIATVIFKESVIDGEWDCKGRVRELKDAQIMYNYWASQEVELLGNASKAPYIGYKGQFEGMKEWEDSNVVNYPYLEVNPITVAGQIAPLPQRQAMAQIPIGVVNAKASISEDMKDITGMYDSTIGAPSSETSGRAILAREAQGDTANYHVIDNYTFALNHSGNVINQMIPIYYDTQRVITIMGDDDETEQIELLTADENGEKIDWGEGEYDIIVEVGPTFTTKRKEAASSIMEMMAQIPEIAQVSADLGVKMMDWDLSDEVAGRLKRAIEMRFPGMTAPIEEEGDNKDELSMLSEQLQQLTANLQEAGQQNQQLQANLQKIDQMKIMSEQQKQVNESRRLEIEAKKVENDFILGNKKLRVDINSKDLEVESQLQINHNNNQVELIKHGASVEKIQIDKFGAETKRRELTKEETAINNGQLIKEQLTDSLKSEMANIQNLIEQSTSELKSRKPVETTATKQADGSYKTVTTYENGETLEATAIKTENGFKIEDNDG